MTDLPRLIAATRSRGTRRVAPAQHSIRNHSDTGDAPDRAGQDRHASGQHSAAGRQRRDRGWQTMTNTDLLPAIVLKRKAVVYVRQSSQSQVQNNLESQRRQYDLVEEARRRGFRDIEVIDDDLGRSASGMVARPGFDQARGLALRRGSRGRALL